MNSGRKAAWMEGSGAEILTMLFPGLRKTRWWSIYKQGKIGGGTGGTRKGKKRDRWHISVRFYPRDMSCTFNINELKMTYFFQITHSSCSESNSVSAALKNYYDCCLSWISQTCRFVSLVVAYNFSLACESYKSALLGINNCVCASFKQLYC